MIDNPIIIAGVVQSVFTMRFERRVEKAVKLEIRATIPIRSAITVHFAFLRTFGHFQHGCASSYANGYDCNNEKHPPKCLCHMGAL